MYRLGLWFSLGICPGVGLQGDVYPNVYCSTIYNIQGNGNPLQYSCLEKPMDGGAWWAAVHAIVMGRTRLSDFTFMHWRRKWQPTPVFLTGESQGWGNLVGCCL